VGRVVLVGRCRCGAGPFFSDVALAEHMQTAHGCDIDAEGWCDTHAEPWRDCIVTGGLA